MTDEKKRHALAAEAHRGPTSRDFCRRWASAFAVAAHEQRDALLEHMIVEFDVLRYAKDEPVPFRRPPFTEEGDTSPEAEMWRAVHAFGEAHYETKNPSHPWDAMRVKQMRERATRQVESAIAPLRGERGKEHPEWEALAVELRTRESRMSGILCDLVDVPSDPLEGLRVLAAHYRATRVGRARPTPLSEAAQAARRPLPPDVLAGALQDRVHVDAPESPAVKR